MEDKIVFTELLPQPQDPPDAVAFEALVTEVFGRDIAAPVTPESQ